ncbi:mitochondrial iron uptake protein [Ophiostoma piceae UAMH 11346]|uniref:ferroxidase n=1 Tax=Ophiostoma piceae (strain UAMH 11346) TaxID=1262450 RepID=S3C2L6_OPHP1|nr:mitochondrial iron uptake protein [Ophiostoma piceae UAMH 11346]
MPRPALSVPSRLARRLAAPMATLPSATTTPRTAPATALRACRQCRLPASRRLFSTTPRAAVRASSSRLAAPSIAAYKPQASLEPAALSDTEYHALADDYLEKLVVRLEDMQDAREDVDVEYSSGVLTLAFDPSESTGGRARTYVINKQPPNKQIWLSSPVSGPKRYDWVVDGSSGSSGSGGGRWIYLKDNTAFNDLLRDEIGLDLDDQGCEEQ